MLRALSVFVLVVASTASSTRASEPVRDLSRDAPAQRLLGAHPVYVSLTTSPRRIHDLAPVIDSLDLTHVTKIFLTLPSTFERTGERYQIPAWIRRHPHIEVLRPRRDLGPITKMLPAIEKATAIDPESIVLSIDDDVVYPKGMVNEVVHHMARSRRTAFGGGVDSLAMYGVDLARWPYPIAGRRDFAEGWAGIAYRAGEIDTRLLRRLARTSRETRLSDDLVINYVLAHQGIRRAEIRNEYYSIHGLRPLPQGREADALHLGAGLVGLPDPHAANAHKYVRGLDDLNRRMARGAGVDRARARRR